MGREGRELWAKRVERWADSGLTAGEFAAEMGLDAKKLTRWKWRLKAAASPARAANAAAIADEPGFVEVIATPVRKAAATKPLAARVEPLEVVVGEGGLRIRVPRGFEPAALRRLVSALEGR